MDLRPGDYVASPTFQAVEESGDKTHNFCVLLYPRGGGHNSNIKPGSGFGMGYKMFSDKDQKLGVYLQYLPPNPHSTVDATFSLLLKGQQKQGPRFDVQWTSGMRFVSPDACNLREGMANDFGANLMQTQLLPVFLGVQDDDDAYDAGKLKVQVGITIHPSSLEATETKESTQKSLSNNSGGIFPRVDIRQVKRPDGDVLSKVHDTERVRVGKIVVPVLQKLSQRPRMFELGAYPGVEYRIMRIFDPSGRQVFESVPGADYELKPIYPLVNQLEREWPVRVNEAEIPKLLTSGMYNAISAIGSLFTAIGGLATAFVVSQAISLFFIPSKSMSPTLSVGDVLVVEKVTPRILGGNKRIGDVVLFSPPSRLREIVSSSGGRITDRDLFVKRIAAGPGDVVSVDASGAVKVNNVPTKERRDMCDAEPLRLIEKFIQPGSFAVQDQQVVVLGDCSSVSIDSRVWGPLAADEIVGRPLFRIWPLERMGPVPALPTRSETDWTE
jgi:signal peptidase I